MAYFLQQCLNAVQVSAFYGLLAIAYVLLYGIANRINLAFGAIAMWGAHLAASGMFILVALSPFGIMATVLLAIAYALAGTAALGFVVQRNVIRPLVTRRSLAILIATIGLAIVLEELVRLASHGRDRWLSPMLDEPLVVLASGDFAVQISEMRGLVMLISFALAAGLILFMSRHRFGRDWRACSQDLRMAALCGIDVDLTLALSFVISSAYAAASGAVIALYYGNVSFHMGAMLGLKTLLAAVIGGLGSIGGALAGAFLLGFLESFWSAYFAVEYRDVVVFGALALVMIFRPRGLFVWADRGPPTLNR